MTKTLIIIVAATFIAFGFTPGAFAAGIDKSTDQSMSSDATSLSAEATLIGKDVKNLQEEDLGEVKSLVRDEDGEISLVIVSVGDLIGIGEKDVAVPYTALAFDESEDHAVLNFTREQLASAPEVAPDENLKDRSFAEEVYRHFGERPYWSEKGGAADEGFSREFDADRDRELDTNEYFGTDKGPGAGQDLPRGGAGLDSGMDSE